MPISTPRVPNSTPSTGVSNFTPVVAVTSVVLSESSTGILSRSSKVRHLSICVSMVASYSTSLTIETGIGTTLNCLREMCLPVFRQRKV